MWDDVTVNFAEDGPLGLVFTSAADAGEPILLSRIVSGRLGSRQQHLVAAHRRGAGFNRRQSCDIMSPQSRMLSIWSLNDECIATTGISFSEAMDKMQSRPLHLVLRWVLVTAGGWNQEPTAVSPLRRPRSPPNSTHGALPQFWESHVSRTSGEHYYHNTRTGENTYAHPSPTIVEEDVDFSGQHRAMTPRATHGLRRASMSSASSITVDSQIDGGQSQAAPPQRSPNSRTASKSRTEIAQVHLHNSSTHKQEALELALALPLKDWSVTTVSKWLTGIGLARYCGHFKRHHVDGEALMRFGALPSSEWPWAVLEMLGVQSLSHRSLIVQKLSELPDWSPKKSATRRVSISCSPVSVENGDCSPMEVRESRRLEARLDQAEANARQQRDKAAKANDSLQTAKKELQRFKDISGALSKHGELSYSCTSLCGTI